MESPPRALGLVIVNLQRTRLDKKCAIRVWSTLDRAFDMIARNLGLTVTREVLPPLPPSDIFVVPYNAEGVLDPKSRMELDLRPGQQVKIVTEGPTFGDHATVIGRSSDGDFTLDFTTARRRLGRWWIYAAQRGEAKKLPLVNLHPSVTAVPSPSGTPSADTDEGDAASSGDEIDIVSMSLDPAGAPAPPATPALPAVIRIVQSHEEVVHSATGNSHNWGVRIDDASCPFVASVTWTLHPTFRLPVINRSTPPFGIDRNGWGTFAIGVAITLKPEYSGRVLIAEHKLTFSSNGPAVKVTDVPTKQ